MLLKMLLTPLLILLCAAIARRWGAFVGGAVAGLPLISGPVSFFLTLEQGPAFAAAASYNTLLGVVACAATALAYPWLAVRGLPWFGALPLSLAGYFVTGWAVQGLPHAPWLALGLALAMPLGILALLPPVPQERPGPSHPLPVRLRLPLQMAWGAALVLGVTTAAQRLGPGWSGVLMFFPVMICAIMPFVHAAGGAGAVVCAMRGFMAGWFGCIAFAVAIMTGVERLPLWPCYALATAAALLAGAGVTLLEERRFAARAQRGKRR